MKTTDEDLNQFTFFRSYYEAIEDLPEKVQLNVLKAIIEYALYGKEIAVSGTAKVAFKLCKPTLDKSRAKARNARKSNENKTESNEIKSNQIENEIESNQIKSDFIPHRIKDKDKDKDIGYKDKEVIYALPLIERGG